MAEYRSSAQVRAGGEASVGGLFAARAKIFPNKIALSENGKTLTYAALELRSNQVANLLVSQGLEVGDRVAILVRNCSDYLVLELAAAKSGCIVAALNWRLAERELKHSIELVEPKLLIHQPEFGPTVAAIAPDMERWCLNESFEERLANMPSEQPRTAGFGEDGLVILYTSGTTGMPKGALISHRAMIARAACFFVDLGLDAQDDFIAWAPLYHMASTDHALATLMQGGTVHIVDGYQPERICEILEEAKIGWFVLMPGIVGEFAAFAAARKLKVRGIKACGAMADLVPLEDIAAATAALQTPYLNSFGATETGMPPATRALIPVGEVPNSLSKQQSSAIEVRLVDPEDRDVATGEPGEVALRGPTLFSGYWNADATNAQDFRNGWFHMGDVMRRNADGTLDYVDRVKYLIKSGGENIYPAEIEHVIQADARVREAIVVRRADIKWGEVPVLFVVPEGKITVEALQSLCSTELSGYKRPKEIILISDEDVPRSTTGKIQRHVLEDRLRRR